KSALKLFGINYADQIIGTSIWQLYPPERHGIVRARNQTMEQTGQSVPIIEHTMLRFDGSRIQVEAMACPIDYEGIPSVYVALRDISERKKNRLLIELQHKVSKFFIESANVLDISNQFLESVCLDLGLTKGMVWALDKEANMLRLITYWTAGDSNEALANVDQFVPINFGIAGKVIGTGEADWVLQDEEIDKVTIAIPIVNEQEILGVIELINDTNKTRDEVILDTLIAFGEQIGLFIKRKKFEKDLAYLTKHDPITGLSNRAFFEETLQYELHLAQANDTRLAIIFIDIDSFGIINQTIGHTQGDVLLQKIGGMLSKTITSKENLARFGPQFAVLISDIEGFDDINGLINEINENVATVVSVADQKINIILNFGIALYPDDGTQVQELLQAASIAVGSAREKSGGTIQFFSSELNKRTKSRLRIETDLREALEKQELFLLYQPIVDSASMKVAGFEALLRWEHAGKLISPAEFIPIAEKNHLINPIGAYAMRTACQQCKEWIDQFKVPISISVNISPIQL
ncbi:diguanylate cyclase, partial [Candidatus Saccharibacteria bacterium]|nr:diguanylate cyclase [Candidatus Saccharibacteria bacterium]